MDGESFEYGSDEHEEHIPPLTDCEGRDNCRCVLVYEFEDGDDAGDELQEGLLDPDDSGEGEGSDEEASGEGEGSDEEADQAVGDGSDEGDNT